MTVTRRYTFKLYPNKTQLGVMDDLLGMHQRLYNALIEQRRDAWDRCKTSLGHYDQSKHITELRAAMPEYNAIQRAPMEVTSERVDQAYKKYFDNVKRWKRTRDGLPPKPPRYQRYDDFPGWGYKKEGKAWKMERNAKGGRAYFKDLGWIKFRGKFPIEPKDIRTCEIIRRAGNWMLSVVVKQDARMKKGRAKVNINLDLIEKFADISVVKPGDSRPCDCGQGVISGDGSQNHQTKSVVSIDPGQSTTEFGGDTGCASGNTVWTTGQVASKTGGDTGVSKQTTVVSKGQAAAEIGEAGFPSAFRPHPKGRAPEKMGRNKRLRHKRQEAKIARRRKEELHVMTTEIVRLAKSVDLTRPDLKEVTKSGKGNEKEWGAAVKFKALINRHILNQTPGAFIEQLKYKLEESGAEFVETIKEDHKANDGNKVVKAKKTVRKARQTIRKAA
jgi:transposase